MNGKNSRMKKFISELNNQDWDKILGLDMKNITETIHNYPQYLNNILEKYAPLKKFRKKTEEMVSTKTLDHKKIESFN